MARPVSSKARKEHTSISIDPNLKRWAIEYGVNISFVAEEALRREQKRVQQQERRNKEEDSNNA